MKNVLDSVRLCSSKYLNSSSIYSSNEVDETYLTLCGFFHILLDCVMFSIKILDVCFCFFHNHLIVYSLPSWMMFDDTDTISDSRTWIATSRNPEISLYSLYASVNSGSMICFVVLKGDNYSEWSMEMFNALWAKRNIWFFDGMLQKPINGSNNFDVWLSKLNDNRMVPILYWSKSVINCDVYLWCSQVVGESQEVLFDRQ